MDNNTRLDYICKLVNEARKNFFNRQRVADIINAIEIVARERDEILLEPHNLKQIKELAGDT